MRWIPQSLLRRLYTLGSLQNTSEGWKFTIKNRLAQASITKLYSLSLNNEPLNACSVYGITTDDKVINPELISETNPLDFPLGSKMVLHVAGDNLPKGNYRISLAFRTVPFGKLEFSVMDTLHEHEAAGHQSRFIIPRQSENDLSQESVVNRQSAIEDYAQIKLNHLKQYSFDSQAVKNNVENFVGVAQVPVGVAGPINIQGEYAQGDFLVPLATTEGSLIASYNRGIKLINACGGVRCTVTRDVMQRAPAFVMTDARAAREFLLWSEKMFPQLKEISESTSSFASLLKIETYQLAHQAFLRFVFSTGDAAGQNMVTRATFEACQWIMENYPDIRHFHLEANMATDKKHSHINVLQGRGKSVTAEILIPPYLLTAHLGIIPKQLMELYQSGIDGSYLSAATSNGLHAANGLAAMYTATGQDIANLAESSQSYVQLQLTKDDYLKGSIVLPSLIVATRGGGTGLPTQSECLQLMDCYGDGKVKKLAEIMAGVVLAGELSLAGAIASLDWVPAHESMGKNYR